MNDLHLNMLHIHAWGNDGKVTFDWRGKSIERDPGKKLAPFFRKVMSETEGSNVVIDISALEYLNSQTITAIIFFMRDLESMNIPAILCYNKKSDWQATMCHAIGVMARDMEHVQVKGV